VCACACVGISVGVGLSVRAGVGVGAYVCVQMGVHVCVSFGLCVFVGYCTRHDTCQSLFDICVAAGNSQVSFYIFVGLFAQSAEHITHHSEQTS